MVVETELYDVLNVKPTASAAEIKSAYRKMALKYHPDKNSSPGAAEMFKRAAEAYEILGDEDARRKYDAQGKAAATSSSGGGSGAAASGMTPEDIFAAFFGGGPRGFARARQPRDVLITLPVSLEEFCMGTKKSLVVMRRRMKRQGGFVEQFLEQAHVTVEVEPGMADGDAIRLAGEGDQHPAFAAAGDILVVLEEKEHPNFFRRGNDLWVKHVKLTLTQALCGVTIPVEHLDGRIIHAKLSPNQTFSPSFVYCGRGEGMPVRESRGVARGDLCFQVAVLYPRCISDIQMAVFSRVLLPYRSSRPDDLPTDARVVYLKDAHGSGNTTTVLSNKGKKKSAKQQQQQQQQQFRGFPAGAHVHHQECKTQ